MEISRNTLQLMYDLLCRQQIVVGAPRSEIDAVLAAKEELERELNNESISS